MLFRFCTYHGMLLEISTLKKFKVFIVNDSNIGAGFKIMYGFKTTSVAFI